MPTPTAKQLKELLISRIKENEFKSSYGKLEVIALITQAHTDLLERKD